MKLNGIKESQDAFARLHEMYQAMTRPFRILLVEDDSRDIELISRAFNHYRVEFKSAITGEEAVQWLQQMDFELCLLDLKLTGMSGVDVLNWATDNQCKVPFVVLTGLNENNEMLSKAMDAGAKCIIRKPLDQADVKIILGAVR